MITRHVVIGGMKHCGKSTQGKRLAEFWQVPFFDTDTLLEEAYCRVTGKKRTCREIFREEGENFFRQREADHGGHNSNGGGIGDRAGAGAHQIDKQQQGEQQIGLFEQWFQTRQFLFGQAFQTFLFGFQMDGDEHAQEVQCRRQDSPQYNVSKGMCINL